MDESTFDCKKVYQIIKTLSVDIGPRFSGSSNCLKAGDYIESYFRNLNLQVSEQTFNVTTGALEEYKLEILVPAIGEIFCSPVYFLKDTPPEGLVGDVIYLENTETLESGSNIEGKIVLIPASAIRSDPNPQKIFQYHPAAILTISEDPGFKPRHDIALEQYFKPFTPVPVFRITWEDGYKLVQSNVQKARVKLKSTTGRGKARNIIGELRGTEIPDEIIVISGHYDSPPDTPSATDNASGTAMMMELARIYAKKKSKRTIRFIAMDAEEMGTMGSRLYARTLQDEYCSKKTDTGVEAGITKSLLEKHLLCINMDVLGMALGQHACYVIGPEELSTAIRLLNMELAIPQQVITDKLYGSDHEPFAWVGIPAIDFSRIGPSMRYIHTNDDRVDLIKLDCLQDVGIVINTFIERYVANSALWPFPRKIPVQQTEMLKQIFEKIYQWKLLDTTEICNEN